MTRPSIRLYHGPITKKQDQHILRLSIGTAHCYLTFWVPGHFHSGEACTVSENGLEAFIQKRQRLPT